MKNLQAVTRIPCTAIKTQCSQINVFKSPTKTMFFFTKNVRTKLLTRFNFWPITKSRPFRESEKWNAYSSSTYRYLLRASTCRAPTALRSILSVRFMAVWCRKNPASCTSKRRQYSPRNLPIGKVSKPPALHSQHTLPIEEGEGGPYYRILLRRAGLATSDDAD